MSAFERRINLKHLKKLSQGAPEWLDDLFRFWAPAGSGTRPDANAPLRFAIHKNYANFYVGGQSVAKVGIGPNVLTARVHEKYLESNSEKRNLLSQKYILIDDQKTTSKVADWMAVASGYLGLEKQFVERLVAANPNVVDMEMALPALKGSRSAVRMDLVALEPFGDGWRLAFWEAKMADNKEARAKKEVEPKVFQQRKNYQDWLAADGSVNKKIVMAAYQDVCRYLIDIYRLVSQAGLAEGLPQLGDGIRAVAEGAAMTLDDKVRLIIDDSINDESFVKNGHRDKLKKNEHVVQVVSKDGDHILQSHPE